MLECCRGLAEQKVAVAELSMQGGDAVGLQAGVTQADAHGVGARCSPIRSAQHALDARNEPQHRQRLLPVAHGVGSVALRPAEGEPMCQDEAGRDESPR